MALYNQSMAVWIIFKKNKGPFYHMRLCRNNGSQLLFWETGGKGVSYGSLDLWQDPGHLSSTWAASYPASQLPRLAGACFLLPTLVLWTNPTLALQEWAQKPGLFLSYDPVLRNYSYKGTDYNNPIYPVFLASAMRNEETDKALWEPSLCMHLRLGPLL